VTPTAILRDAYHELDETGSLSRSTQQALSLAGFDVGVMLAADYQAKEIED
jgi:hypothetical protein